MRACARRWPSNPRGDSDSLEPIYSSPAANPCSASMSARSEVRIYVGERGARWPEGLALDFA